ncbi:MAG: diacylglycerol kinase family protein [Bacteroidota bacterium]
MKHLVFIVNPKSGVERNKKVQIAIDKCLDTTIYSHEIQYTERIGHGEDLARNAAQNGAFAVVAVGGDGSVNDIIRGLYGTGVLLAILPKGSGNGLARTLSIPVDTEKALQVINRGLTDIIDVGFANEKLFASNAGVGYDALICKKFANSQKRGLSVYAWLITKYMWLYRDWTFQIEVDGQELEETAFFISVANGRQFGYNFKIAEDASWTDGLLDVVIIRKFPKILGALLGFRMLTGTLLKSRYVHRIRGKEIKISNPKLKLMQTDGDAVACSPMIHFRIEQNAQKVIVGALDAQN